ncbi:hypothetical protein K439DRAFT_1567690 [Ramaria rubella]|nr:hypothetical protein K439DRAFT_1567690 [Ramaria rubella]
MWLWDPSLSHYPYPESLFQIKLPHYNTLEQLVPVDDGIFDSQELTHTKGYTELFQYTPFSQPSGNSQSNHEGPHIHRKILLLKIHILESIQKILLWTPISPWGVQAQLTGDIYLNIDRKGNWKCKPFQMNTDNKSRSLNKNLAHRYLWLSTVTPTAHLGVQPLASVFHVLTSQPISYPPALLPLPPSPPSTPNKLNELVQQQQQLERHMGTLASTCQAMQTGTHYSTRTFGGGAWRHQKTDEEKYLAACIRDFMTYFSIQLKNSASDEDVHNYVVEDGLAGNFLAHGFMVVLTKQWYCHEDLPELTLTGLRDQFIQRFYDFKDTWKEAVMSPELREKHKQEYIVNTLGTTGMSGDETNIEETPARPDEPLHQWHRFHRVKLGFQSAEVTKVLHTIDHQYREHHALWLGNARPRNTPHEQILEPLRTDWTKEVEGLPHNFYNKTWKEVDDWSPAYP